MPHITSFDVARRAGVSQPTVSRALRDLPVVSRATRDRVRQAADELGYAPHDSGRVLSTRTNRRIAVVSDQLTNPYYPELIEPVRHLLAADGYRTVLLTDPELTTDKRETLDSLAQGSYDGALLTTTSRRSTLPRDLAELGLPHVLVNRTLDSGDSPSCTIDNIGGSMAIADLLVGLGHRRIAAIQGPVTTSTGRQRAAVLRQRLRHHGLSIPRASFVRCDFSHDSGFAAAIQLLSRPTPPTAIACGNDVLALGAMSAARQLGVSVPADLTIVGFDDIEMAGWPIVSLTTVHCDLGALAAGAVGLLMDQLAGVPRDSVTHIVDVSLRLRGTHGPTALSS